MANDMQNSKGYSKRPLWQWILLYVIVGGLIYFAIYYFYMRNHTNPYGNSSQSQSATSSSSIPPVNNAILSTKTDSKLGQYLTDSNGHPLYIYGGDSNGVSNCTGSCISLWPAYQDSGATTGLPAGIGTIKRTDNGETQFTYNGMPLYTFTSDSNNQVTGNGTANFTVAKPVANPTPSTSTTSSSSSSDSSSPTNGSGSSW